MTASGISPLQVRSLFFAGLLSIIGYSLLVDYDNASVEHVPDFRGIWLPKLSHCPYTQTVLYACGRAVKSRASSSFKSFSHSLSLRLLTKEEALFGPNLICCFVKDFNCSDSLFRDGDIHLNPGPVSSLSLGCDLPSSARSPPHADIDSRPNYSLNNNRSPLTTNIKLFYANVRSIKNKLRDLQVRISSNFDIVSLTESWLNQSIIDSEILSSEYCIFRHDRSSRGGGVMLAVKDYLCPVRFDVPASAGVEATFVSCRAGTRSILIGSVYRPPSGSLSEIQDFADAMRGVIPNILKFDAFILTGDFNISVNWSTTWDPIPADIIAEELCALFDELALTQLVHSATRNDKILDLVLSNNKSFLSHVQVVDNLPGCDHDAISGSILCPKFFKQRINYSRLDIKNADIDKLAGLWVACPWDVAFSTTDINGTWDLFLDLFWSCVNEAVPRISCCGIKRDPWISGPITNLIKKKRSLYKSWRRDNSDKSRSKYKAACNSLRKITRDAYVNYVDGLYARVTDKPKQFWSFIRAKRKLPPPSTFFVRDEKLTSPQAIANAFNSLFYSNFFSPPGQSRWSRLKRYVQSNISAESYSWITEAEVFKIISDMRNGGTPGPDNVLIDLLKLAPGAIVSPLTKFFNLSLSLGEVPFAWKFAHVVPVYKNRGSRSDLSSYRPISLTSVFSKIMEKALLNRLNKFCAENNVIPNAQFGFRKGRSCTSQVIQSYHFWASALDRRPPADVHVVALDWAKAFDRVNHRILLEKLAALKIDSLLLNWIADFLSGRTQSVVFQGKISSALSVPSGVPQGAILSPLLFNIFTADLPKVLLHSSVHQYADDTYLSLCVSNVKDHSNLQEDLNNLFDWSNDNCLELNITKCMFMVISRRRSLPSYSYSINGVTLVQVHVLNILGILISSDLKWEKQTRSVCRKARQINGLIWRAVGRSSASLPLFKSLTLPILEYGVQVWHPHLVKETNLLEAVQRNFTRSLLGLPKNRRNNSEPSYSERLTKLNILSLKARREIAVLKLLFKFTRRSMELDDPDYYYSWNLRHSVPTLSIPFARCNEFKHSFFPNSARLWNSLPSEVRCCTSFSCFSAALLRFYFKDFS